MGAWWRPSPFGQLVLAALLMRLVLLPVCHTWDTRSWVNVLAELALPASPIEAVNRPYATEREQSFLAQAAGRQDDHYEYWAYPPLMLYVYWPIAQLQRLVGAIPDVSFPVQPAFATSAIPLGASALARVPVMIADIAILWLLRGLGVGLREVRWYAFNPLVLLVGAWTFDAVMVAFLLAALWLAEREQWARSSLAVALGAATKFVPLVVLPCVVLAILRRPAPVANHVRTLLAALIAAGGALVVLVWPVRDGVLYVLRFHAARFGAGLTFQESWFAWGQQSPGTDWQPAWQLYASSELGALLLPLTLFTAGVVLTWRTVQLSTGFLVLVLAFLVGSKLVNEPYVAAPLALATVELARRPSNGLRACRELLWVVAFSYAMLNTPVWAFVVSPIQHVLPGLAGEISLWADAYRFFRGTPEAALPYALLGTTFTVLAALTMWVACRTAWRTGQEVAHG